MGVHTTLKSRICAATYVQSSKIAKICYVSRNTPANTITLDGMVNVKNIKRRTEGCGKLASFEVAGTKTAEYCARHSLDGMVQVKSRKYKTKRCGKKPLFGVADTRAAEYGAQHTKRTSVRPPPTKTSQPSGASRHSRKRIRHPEITSTASKRAVAGVVTMPDIDGQKSPVKRDSSVKMEVQLSL